MTFGNFGGGSGAGFRDGTGWGGGISDLVNPYLYSMPLRPAADPELPDYYVLAQWWIEAREENESLKENLAAMTAENSRLLLSQRRPSRCEDCIEIIREENTSDPVLGEFASAARQLSACDDR